MHFMRFQGKAKGNAFFVLQKIQKKQEERDNGLNEKMFERFHWFKELKGVNWLRLIGLFVFAKAVSGFFYLDAIVVFFVSAGSVSVECDCEESPCYHFQFGTIKETIVNEFGEAEETVTVLPVKKVGGC
jgi:hypothetical protein